ncbi:MAG: NAD(P)-dependent oxidoreductase, partial [Alphaproteobacteria bacterium]
MGAKAAFIGLGIMGYPMAGHLQKAGWDVTVYNRTGSRAEDWAREYGGHTAKSPRAAVHGAALVFACVGNDDDVRDIAIGTEGAFAGMDRDSVFIDHTTASASLARELAERAGGQDIGFVDAPVSGGQAGAENGQLTIMAGGEQKAYDAARPAMEAYAKKVKLMGPAGAGQLTKM